MINLQVDAASKTGTESKWLLALTLILVGGILIGAWFFLITYHYHLTIFSVLSPALAGGAVISYAIWKGRIQHRILSLTSDILLASIIYGTFQGLRYGSFRNMAINQYMADYDLNAVQAEQMLENTLLKETGSTGIVGYIQYQIRTGMAIGSAFSLPGEGRQVTGTEYLIYGLYDFGMLLVGTVGSAWQAVRRLYCRHCNQYYGRVVTGYGNMGLATLGWIDRVETEKFLQLLAVKHFEQAGTLLKSKHTRSAGVELQVERCNSCNTNPSTVIGVRPRTALNHSQPMVFQHKLSSDEYERLLSFTTVYQNTSWLSVNERWFITMSFLALFVGGITLLIGLLRSSI